MISLKNLFIPANNGLKSVTAVQLWSVNWTSRYGIYHSDTRKEIEVFTTLEAAEEFQLALIAAFKLVRHTSNTEVYVKKID